MKYEDMAADYGDSIVVTLNDGRVLRGILADIDLDYDNPSNDRISVDSELSTELLLSEISTISQA